MKKHLFLSIISIALLTTQNLHSTNEDTKAEIAIYLGITTAGVTPLIAHGLLTKIGMRPNLATAAIVGIPAGCLVAYALIDQAEKFTQNHDFPESLANTFDTIDEFINKQAKKLQPYNTPLTKINHQINAAVLKQYNQFFKNN